MLNKELPLSMLQDLQLLPDTRVGEWGRRLASTLVHSCEDSENLKHYRELNRDWERQLPSWDEFLALVPCLQQDGYKKFAKQLGDLCAFRKGLFREACLMVPVLVQGHIPDFTHAAAAPIAAIIRELIREAGVVDEALEQVISQDGISSLDKCSRVISILHELHPLGGSRQFETALPKLEAVEAVLKAAELLQHRPQKHSAGPAEFVYCRVCWRLIPESYAKRFGQYCDWHHHATNNKRYRAARRIIKQFNPNHPDFVRFEEPFTDENGPGVRHQFVKDLQKVWTPGWGDISQDNWFYCLNRVQASRRDWEQYPVVDYDLQAIMEKCPHASSFILKNGGNIEHAKSIIDTLNPPLPDANEEEHAKRENLHALFAKNFWLFRIELMMAEALLAQCARHLHGGPRPNSGGRRPGAGRKPKFLQKTRKRKRPPKEANG